MPESKKEKLARRRRDGLCRMCETPAAAARAYCDQHLLWSRQYHAKRRAKFKADGLCIKCGDKVVYGSSRCAKCLETERAAHTPESRRERQLFDLYGISMETYTAMLDDQSGVCALCGLGESYTKSPGATPKTGGKKKLRVYAKRGLSVDHDHATGKIRGLLCALCNIAISVVDRHGLGILENIYLYCRGSINDLASDNVMAARMRLAKNLGGS